MTEAKEGTFSQILNQRLTEIIRGETTKEVEDSLPDGSIALMHAEGIVSGAFKRRILYKVPRVTFQDDKHVQGIASELETLFEFAPYLTNTGRQVIIGDILEYRFGPGQFDDQDPDKRFPIPRYVAGLGKLEDGGLFNEERAPELEARAYRSLKRNTEIATGWVNPPQFLRPLGYEIKDMPDVVQHWESELVQKYGVVPYIHGITSI